MRTILLLLLCVSASLRTMAQADYSTLLFLAPSSGPTYLIKEDFEGTGFDLGEGGVAWVQNSGSPTENPDDTSFNWDGGGGQNLWVQRVGTDAIVTKYFYDPSGSTNKSAVWIYMVFQTNRTNSNSVILQGKTNGTTKGFMRMKSTAQLEIFDTAGGVNKATVAGVPMNTLVHTLTYWDHAAGVGSVEFSTTGTFTGGGIQYTNFTGGETGMKMNQIGILAEGSVRTNLVDKVRVDDVAISSNPP